MVRRLYKHKLLLDANMSGRSRFPRLNGLFDVKHIRDDLNKEGLPDPEVYGLAVRLKRIIVTFNWKDFREMATRNHNTGVIGVSPNLTTNQIDAKLTSLLVHSNSKALLGKFTYLTSET